jgi:hypothetical protein
MTRVEFGTLLLLHLASLAVVTTRGGLIDEITFD